MAIFRHIQTLLLVLEATDEEQTGRTYSLLPSDSDQLADHQLSWRAFVDAKRAESSEPGSIHIVVETSPDGKSWVTALEESEFNEKGTIHSFEEIPALGPYVRARTELDGITPSKYTVSVKLACDGPFRLMAGKA